MLKRIFSFDFSNFRGDFFGGLTAGIVALPLALAFGEQSGLGADAGLYGAIFISFFAAWLGGTNTQISGPTAPMTAVSMVVIAGIIASFEGDREKAIPIILAVFFLAGIIQIVLGFLRIGKYIRYIPYPVVSGFMSGIGVLIIITQIFPFIGYYPAQDQSNIEAFKPKAEEVILNGILEDEADEGLLVLEDFEETVKRAQNITPAEITEKATKLVGDDSRGVNGTVRYFLKGMQNINWIQLLLALFTIFIIYGFKRITTAVPSTLVALIVVTLVAIFGGLDYRTITEIPSGFPTFRGDIFTNFSFSALSPYIFSAIALALLGVIDSLLTSIVADNMTKTKHDPDQELFGQGIGNSIAALFGGIPGAGATIRTVVNINSGGQTRISGMVAGVLLLVILLALGPYASLIPAGVLAGILITVGIGVMDYKGLKHLFVMPRTEAIVIIVVLLLTVFWGLLEAVAIGMIMSTILFMKKISDVIDDKTDIAPLTNFAREIPWKDETAFFERHKDQVYIKHLDGPLFFGFASRFQDMIKALPDIKVVIMRLDKVPYVDQSGLYAMEDAIDDLNAQDIKVVFVDAHGQPLDMFKSINIVPNLIPEEHNFESFEACSQWLEGHLKEVDKIAMA